MQLAHAETLQERRQLHACRAAHVLRIALATIIAVRFGSSSPSQ